MAWIKKSDWNGDQQPVYEWGGGEWTSADDAFMRSNQGAYTGYNNYNTNQTPGGDPSAITGGNTTGATQVVPGPAVGNQINVADYSGQLATNPSLGLTQDDPNTPQNESMSVSDRVTPITEQEVQAGNVTNQASQDFDRLNQTASQVQQAQTAAQVDPRQAETYNAAQATPAVTSAAMTAAQGEVDPRAVIEAPQIDISATAAGTNDVGAALKDFASLDITHIVDTTTAAGKALAQQLGQGNYVDSKATLKGQLDILQSEFEGPNGEAKIPSWASGTARNVSKIAAFKGMTGTAATAAMSQALLEASVAVAQQDAQFFQTVTLENLSNKQQSTINRANVLAQMDLANLDARTAAAVQNSKNFMDMSLANLSNEQQARVINTQSRVQAILEDTKEENLARRFGAEAKNQTNQFYDSLNSAISQFNASQVNNMAQFNTDQVNSMKKFNSELENQREQFYSANQFQVDIANAKWRQIVTLTENQQKFDAAVMDVKNMLGISQEALNQLWDRSDALLDYVWKSSENQLERDQALAIAKLKIESDAASPAQEGLGNILGTVAGAIFSKLSIF